MEIRVEALCGSLGGDTMGDAMLIKSQDKKTILNAGDIAGYEITRGKIYLQGRDQPIIGYALSAILASYDVRIPLAGYEAEDAAIQALEFIQHWIEQGSRGVLEIK